MDSSSTLLIFVLGLRRVCLCLIARRIQAGSIECNFFCGSMGLKGKGVSFPFRYGSRVVLMSVLLAAVAFMPTEFILAFSSTSFCHFFHVINSIFVSSHIFFGFLLLFCLPSFMWYE